MTKPEQDPVFEAYLKRRPVLPALEDKIETPAALDQLVLGKAREALGTRGTGAGGTDAGRRAPRWAVPIALAATILLCLSVVLNISLNTNRPSPNLQRMTDARADLKASAKANAIAESSAASGVEERREDSGVDAGGGGSGKRRESVSGGIPSNEVILPEARVAGAGGPRGRVETDAAGGAPAAAPAPAESADAVDRVAQAGAAARTADAVVRGPRAAKATSAADKAVLFAKEAGVSPAAPMPAVAAQSGVAQSTVARLSAAPAPEAPRAAASQPRSQATGSPPTRAQPLPGGQVGAAGGPEAEPAAVGAHPSDPTVWLEQIRALRAAGKNDAADAQLRRFKVAFPGYAADPVRSTAPGRPPDVPK